jgi:hypothetical protein
VGRGVAIGVGFGVDPADGFGVADGLAWSVAFANVGASPSRAVAIAGTLKLTIATTRAVIRILRVGGSAAMRPERCTQMTGLSVTHRSRPG